jgi:hypothetical protein
MMTKATDKTYMFTTIVLVLFLIGSCNSNTRSSDARTGSTSSSNANYPNGISPQWVNQKLSEWQNIPSSPFILSPTFIGASYDNVDESQNSTQVLNNELNMLSATKAKAITIDIGFDPWLSNNTQEINKITALVNEVKSSGHILVLKDASAEYYRHYQLPWNQFAAAWVKRVRTIAAIFHPAYYTVIKEPPWYAPMIAGLSRNSNSPADRQVLNPNNWINLLSQLISAVKSVSPQTKVGISADANLYNNSTGDKFDLAFFKQAIHLSGLDFLGFDIYTANAFSDTQQFLNQVGTGGKSIWINEAWSITTPSQVQPGQASLDASWAKVLLDFASFIHAQGVSPFFTNFFASYEPEPTTPTGLLTYYSGRTPVFYTFKNYEIAHP